MGVHDTKKLISIDEFITKIQKKIVEANTVKEIQKIKKYVTSIYISKYNNRKGKETDFAKLSSLISDIETKEKELELKFESKAHNMEHEYKKEIHKLKQENKQLNKMLDKFKVTLKRFIKWLCHKFSYPSEDELVRDFEKETYTNFNFEKQLDINQFKKIDDDFDIEI